MQRVCAEVDELKAIAYLETDRERNVGLYSKFGFEVVGESSAMCVARGVEVQHTDTVLTRRR